MYMQRGLLSGFAKRSKMVRAACLVILSLSLLSCGQKEPVMLGITEIKKLVANFYEAKAITGELHITGVAPGERVAGFCILSAYEDRVTADSDKIIPVNAILEKQGLVGTESYWHLIIKTDSGLWVARFDEDKTPLIRPRPAYEGRNCVISKSIIFSKTSMKMGGLPLFGGGPTEMPVINVQPGG